MYFAELIFPSYFVLGNFWLSGPAAMFWVGLWITIILWVAQPLSDKLNFKIDGTLKIFVYYWLVNLAAIWVLARFAALSGLGIAAFYWAIFLGLIANVTQWGLWKGLEAAKFVAKKKRISPDLTVGVSSPLASSGEKSSEAPLSGRRGINTLFQNFSPEKSAPGRNRTST